MNTEEVAELLGVSLADVENEARELGQPSDRALTGEEVPQ